MSEAPNPRAREGRLTRADEPDRAEDVTQVRRRRKSDTVATDPSLARFGIGEDVLDMKKFAYRAVPDTKNRLYDLTQNDDYDFVSLKGDKLPGRDAEGVARYRHGTNLDGTPQWTYLLAKPIEFADEDRARKMARINARERRALSVNNEEAPDKAYTPGQSTQKR